MEGAIINVDVKPNVPDRYLVSLQRSQGRCVVLDHEADWYSDISKENKSSKAPMSTMSTHCF